MHIPGQPSNPPPFLVGREREQSLLRECLSAACAGQGSLVLIGGEAGIGKTALCEALCREAEAQGALVLVGRCYDRTETPPYGPWVEAFGCYPQGEGMPPLPEAFAERGTVGVAASQDALVRQVLDFFLFLATIRPVVLLLDDLHWTDTASLDLLRFVARNVATVPLLLLVSYRSDEVARRHPLYQTLPLLVREARAERVALAALDGQAVRALVEGRYPLPADETVRLVTYLQARAEGNALFVGEVIRALEETGALTLGRDGWRLGDLTDTAVPSLLRQVIEARVGRLDEERQRLLAVAAVIGQVIPLPVWATVGDADEERLLDLAERAEEAHLLIGTPNADEVRFTHALIREALYEGIPSLRRRRLHRRAGETLAATQHPDPDAVAYHFQRAGDARAFEWLIAAGAQAERAYAWLTAADRFAAALALPKAAIWDARKRFRFLCRIAALRRLTSPDWGIAALEEAERLAAGTNDDRLVAIAAYERGQLRCIAGELRCGLAEMERGATALEALSYETADDALESESFDVPARRRGTLATWLARVGRFAEAAVWGERAEGQRGVAVTYAAMGRSVEACRAFVGVQAWHAAQGQSSNVTSAFMDEIRWVAFPYLADEPDALRRLGEAAIRAATEAEGALPDVPPRIVALPIMRLHGEWAAARPLAEAGCAASRYGRGLWATAELVPLVYAQGDAEVAWSLIARWLPGGPATEPGDTHFAEVISFQRVAAALAVDAGDLAAARAWLEAHDRWLAWSGAVLGHAEGQLGWAAYHRAVGNAACACRHAARALAYGRDPRQPLALLTAHRLLGEINTESGRYEDAERHLTESLALADACAAPYERALILLARAEWSIAVGQHTDAAALLGDVRGICEPLGAKPALARAEALAARLPRRKEQRVSHPDGLSDRELAVLRLIAAGKSNRGMADALSISVRTVERHVENVFRKIGVHSKADATAYAFRHRLV